MPWKFKRSDVSDQNDISHALELARLECQTSVIHVVRFCLNEMRDGMMELLDQEELERAARFVFNEDRRRFVVAHAMARITLASCLNRAPTSLRFCVERYGKPRVVDAPQDLRFNLSHAGERALLAVAVAREVGIDIEEHRAIEVFELARRFFGGSEIKALEALSMHERIPAFFRCWTRKEAFIKALGDGLSFPLDGFDVSVAADLSPQLLRACTIAPEMLSLWRVVGLRVERGYTAALAAAAGDWRVVQWDILPETSLVREV